MHFNFIVEMEDKNHIKVVWFLIICWLIIFRNYYIYQNNKLESLHKLNLSQPLFKREQIQFQAIELTLKFLSELDCASCRIKRVDIAQHHVMIYGKVIDTNDFLNIWHRLKQQDYLQKVDFLKWEKVGMQWQFSIKAFY